MSETREKCKGMLGELVKLLRVDTKLSEVSTATTQELMGLSKLYRTYLDNIQPVLATFPLKLTAETVGTILNHAQQLRTSLDSLLSVRATQTYQECARRMDTLGRVFQAAQRFLSNGGTTSHLVAAFNKAEGEGQQVDTTNNNNSPIPSDVASDDAPMTIQLFYDLYLSSGDVVLAAIEQARRSTVAGATLDRCAALLKGKMPFLTRPAVGAAASSVVSDEIKALYKQVVEAIKTLDATLAEDKSGFVRKQRPDATTTRETAAKVITVLDSWRDAVTLAAKLGEFGITAQSGNAQATAAFDTLDKLSTAASGSASVQVFVSDGATMASIKAATASMTAVRASVQDKISAARNSANCLRSLDDTSVLRFTQECNAANPDSFREYLGPLLGWRDWELSTDRRSVTAVVARTGEVIPLLSPVAVPTGAVEASTWLEGVVAELLRTMQVHMSKLCSHAHLVARGSTPFDAALFRDCESNVGTAALLVLFTSIVEAAVSVVASANGSNNNANNTNNNNNQNDGMGALGSGGAVVPGINDVDLATSLEVISSGRHASARRDNQKLHESARLVRDRMSAVAGPFASLVSPARQRSSPAREGGGLNTTTTKAARASTTTTTNTASANLKRKSAGKQQVDDEVNDGANKTRSAMMSPAAALHSRNSDSDADLEAREAAAMADGGGHPSAALAVMSARNHRRACTISLSSNGAGSSAHHRGNQHHQRSASSTVAGAAVASAAMQRFPRNMSTTLRRPGATLRAVVDGLKAQLRAVLAANDFRAVRKFQEWLSWARLCRQLWSQEIRTPLSSTEEYRWVKLLRAYYEKESGARDECDVVFCMGNAWTDRFRWQPPQFIAGKNSSEEAGNINNNNNNNNGLSNLPSLASPALLDLFEKLVVIAMSDRATMLIGHRGSGRRSAVAQIASLLGCRAEAQDLASFAKDKASSLRRARQFLAQGTFLITPDPSSTSSSAEDVPLHCDMLQALLATDNALMLCDPRIVTFVWAEDEGKVPPRLRSGGLFHPCLMPAQLVHNTVELLLECCGFESCLRDAATRVRALVFSTEAMLREQGRYESFFGIEGLSRFATRARDNLWAGHTSTELHAVAQAVEDVWISRATGPLLTSVLARTHASLFGSASIAASASGSVGGPSATGEQGGGAASSVSASGSLMMASLPVTGDKSIDSEIRRLSDPEKAAFVAITRVCDPTRRSYPLHRVRPVLVWGAAGSGKTNAIRVAHAALFDARNIKASIAHVTTTVDGDDAWKRTVDRAGSDEHLWLVFHGTLSQAARNFALFGNNNNNNNNNNSSSKNKINSKNKSNITVFIEADNLDEVAGSAAASLDFALKCDTVRCGAASHTAAVRAVLQSEPLQKRANGSARSVPPALVGAFEAWVEGDLDVSVAVLAAIRGAVLAPSDITVWARTVLYVLSEMRCDAAGPALSVPVDRAVSGAAFWALGALFLSDPNNGEWNAFVQQRSGGGIVPAKNQARSGEDEEQQPELELLGEVAPTLGGALAAWPAMNTEEEERAAAAASAEFVVDAVCAARAQKQKSPAGELVLSCAAMTQVAIGTLVLATHKSMKLRGPSGSAKSHIAQVISHLLQQKKEGGGSNSKLNHAIFIAPGASLSNSLMDAASQSCTALVSAVQTRSAVDRAVLRHLASPTANACASIGLPPVDRIILLESTADNAGEDTNNSVAESSDNGSGNGEISSGGAPTLNIPRCMSLTSSEALRLVGGTGLRNTLSGLCQQGSAACAVAVRKALAMSAVKEGDEAKASLLRDLVTRVIPGFDVATYVAQKAEEARQHENPSVVYDSRDFLRLLPSRTTGASPTVVDFADRATTRGAIAKQLTPKYADSAAHLCAVEETIFCMLGSALTIVVSPPGRGAEQVVRAASALQPAGEEIRTAPAGLQVRDWPDDAPVRKAKWVFIENGAILDAASWAEIRSRKFAAGMRTVVCLRAADIQQSLAPSQTVPAWVREEALFVRALLIGPRMAAVVEGARAAAAALVAADMARLKAEAQEASATEAEATAAVAASSSARQSRSAASLRGGRAAAAASSQLMQQQAGASTTDPRTMFAESVAALQSKLRTNTPEQNALFVEQLYMSVSPDCAAYETSSAALRYAQQTRTIAAQQAQAITEFVGLCRYASNLEKACLNARTKSGAAGSLKAVAEYDLKVDYPRTRFYEGVVKYADYPAAPVRLMLRFEENRNKMFSGVKEAAVFLSTPASEGLFVPAAGGGTLRVRLDGDSVVAQTGFLDMRVLVTPTLQQLQNQNVLGADAPAFKLSGVVTDPLQGHAKIGTCELEELSADATTQHGNKNWLRWGATGGGDSYREEPKPMCDSSLLAPTADQADQVMQQATALLRKATQQVDLALREAVRMEHSVLLSALAASLVPAFAVLPIKEREAKAAALLAAHSGAVPDPLSTPVMAFLFRETPAETLEWLVGQRERNSLPPGAHNDYAALIVRAVAEGAITSSDMDARLMVLDPQGNLTVWLQHYTAEQDGSSVRLPTVSPASSSSAGANNSGKKKAAATTGSAASSASSNAAIEGQLSLLPAAKLGVVFGATAAHMGPVLQFATQHREAKSPLIVVRQDEGATDASLCTWGSHICGLVFDALQSTASLAATLQASPLDAAVVGAAAAAQANNKIAAIAKGAAASRAVKTGLKQLSDWLNSMRNHRTDDYATAICEAVEPEKGLQPILAALEQGRTGKAETQAVCEPGAASLSAGAAGPSPAASTRSKSVGLPTAAASPASGAADEEAMLIARRAAALVAATPRALSSLRLSRAYSVPALLLRQACEKAYSAARREAKGFDLVSRGFIEQVIHGILPVDRLPFLAALAEEVLVEEGAAGSHEWLVMSGLWAATGAVDDNSNSSNSTKKDMYDSIEAAEEEVRRLAQAAAEAAQLQRQAAGGRSGGTRSGTVVLRPAPPPSSKAKSGLPRAGASSSGPSTLRARPALLQHGGSGEFSVTVAEWCGFIIAAESVAIFADARAVGEESLLASIHDPALLGRTGATAARASKWKEWFEKPTLAVPGFEKVSAHARFALAWGYWSVAQPVLCTRLSEMFVADVFGSWVAKESPVTGGVPAIPPAAGSDEVTCANLSSASLQAALIAQTGTALPILLVRDANSSIEEAKRVVAHAFTAHQAWIAAKAKEASSGGGAAAGGGGSGGVGASGAAASSKRLSTRKSSVNKTAAAVAATSANGSTKNTGDKAGADKANNSSSDADSGSTAKIVTLSMHEPAAAVDYLRLGAQPNEHRVVVIDRVEDASREQLNQLLQTSIPVTDAGFESVPTSSLRVVLLIDGSSSNSNNSEDAAASSSSALSTLTKTMMPRCHISNPTSRMHVKKQLELFCLDHAVQSAIAMAPNDTWRRLIFLCGAVCTLLRAREAGVVSPSVVGPYSQRSSSASFSGASSTSGSSGGNQNPAFDHTAAITVLLRNAVSTMLTKQGKAVQSGQRWNPHHSTNAGPLTAAAQVGEVPWDSVRRALAVLLSSASPRSQAEAVEAYIDWLVHPATLTPDSSSSPVLDIGGLITIPMVSPCPPSTFASAVRDLPLPDVDAENIVGGRDVAAVLLGTRAKALSTDPSLLGESTLVKGTAAAATATANATAATGGGGGGATTTSAENADSNAATAAAANDEGGAAAAAVTAAQATMVLSPAEALEEAALRHIGEFLERVEGSSMLSAAQVVIGLSQLRECMPCVYEHLLGTVIRADTHVNAVVKAVARVSNEKSRTLADVLRCAAGLTPSSSSSAANQNTNNNNNIGIIISSMPAEQQRARLDNTGSAVQLCSQGFAELAEQADRHQQQVRAAFINVPSVRLSSTVVAGQLSALACAGFADHVCRRGPEAALDEVAVVLASTAQLMAAKLNNTSNSNGVSEEGDATTTTTFAMLGQVQLAGATTSAEQDGKQQNMNITTASSAINNNSSSASALSRRVLLRKLHSLGPSLSDAGDDLGGTNTSSAMRAGAAAAVASDAGGNFSHNNNTQQQYYSTALRFVVRRCTDAVCVAEMEELQAEERRNNTNKDDDANNSKDGEDASAVVAGAVVAPFWGSKLSPIGLSRRYLLCSQLQRPPVALHCAPAVIVQGSLRASALRNSLPGGASSMSGSGNLLGSTSGGQQQQQRNSVSNAVVTQVQLKQSVFDRRSGECGFQRRPASSPLAATSDDHLALYVEAPSNEPPQYWTLTGTHLRATAF